MQSDSKQNTRIVRDTIMHCSKVAGIQGKQTVLLLREEMMANCLQDIATFMKQGTFPIFVVLRD